MRFNGKPTTDAGALTALVAADTATGGFLKDDQTDDLASGFLYGLTLANNGTDATNDIDIAAGKCIDSTNAVLMSLSALTKRLDANWAAGTNQGMRNSAAAITDTTYHIYAVCKAAGADPDIYAHTSATVATVLTALQAETGGSAYLYARRIGSILRESGAIVAFTQDGDEFLRSTPTRDIADNSDNSSAILRTLKVPTGIKVRAKVAVAVLDTTPATSNARYLLHSSPDQADVAPTSALYTVSAQAFVTGLTLTTGDTMDYVRTNTSAQIRTRLNANDTGVYVVIDTHGWIDTRGRLAA